ncbi:hypothetical protein STAQ_34850 [Allostella sp. ATCC 35155]|nr:hypothetical protein STAQ_34850 [Stella sp. ATCC 35155]
MRSILFRPLAAAATALLLLGAAASEAAAQANPPPSGAQEMKPEPPVPLPPPAKMAETTREEEATDLIRDRPRTLNKLWAMVAGVAGWTADTAMDAIDVIAPPSAKSLASARDTGHLFKLLGLAGYKMKEIDNLVGLIPGLSFKFGLVREVSEADLDYLDEQMDLHRLNNPGLLSELQRGIVSTVVAINSGGGMQVSELKLTVLPLPKAEFAITPSEAALSEEGSALMRAIQRVDRRLRDLAKTEVRAAVSEARQ